MFEELEDMYHNENLVECPWCMGTGMCVDEDHPMWGSSSCPWCGGLGTLEEEVND